MFRLLQHRLGAISYHDLSHRIIPQLLGHISLQRRGCMWFMFAGAPTHVNIAIRTFLKVLPRTGHEGPEGE